MKTLVLLACCKDKLDHAAPARELYQGQLFKKSLAFAQTFADKIIILSAKHGPTELDQVIEPYNVTLNHGMSKMEKLEYTTKCWKGLAAYEGWRFVYLAGDKYRRGLPHGEAPMEGLPIGKQLQWLTNKLKERKTA